MLVAYTHSCCESHTLVLGVLSCRVGLAENDSLLNGWEETQMDQGMDQGHEEVPGEVPSASSS